MITVEKKSVKVGKYVNTEYVDTVIRTYKQERWAQNSERLGKEDSLSIWFSAEDISDFLSTMQEHGADGVKFYFAAYPKDFAAKPEYAGRQTIVMVATKAKETELGTVNKDVYYIKDGQSSILAQNMGGMCPPLCGPGRGRDGSELGITIVDQGDKGVTIV